MDSCTLAARFIERACLARADPAKGPVRFVAPFSVRVIRAAIYPMLTHALPKIAEMTRVKTIRSIRFKIYRFVCRDHLSAIRYFGSVLH